MAEQNTKFYPPVVTVLGHVDHGKTSLLDAVRKTSIAARETGGITQKIGTSEIEIEHEGKKRKITFIDTPGHEAFALMRSRGAQAADIGLLIVSSVDGVMPQTVESIKLLKSSQIPFIVVLTKSDVVEKNVEKVKQQLLKEEVMIEGYGGDVPIIEVSSKTGANIKELLDLILLVNDFRNHDQISDEGTFRGIIIESKLDERSGPKATMIIKNGRIGVKDDISAGEAKGRIRMLINSFGKNILSASVGEGVEVLGFDKVPQVGSLVSRKGEEEEAHSQEKKQNPNPNPDDSIITLIIAADTQGSLEAIINALPPKINVILQKTGEITTADILFAKSVNGLVLGFNTKLRPNIVKLAVTEKVLLKNYNLIYEMLDEIKDVLEGKELSMQEEILGEAQILAKFPYEKTQVMGIRVLDGRIAKGDRIRILRSEEVLGEGNITSVRQGKESISKVEKGLEAGIIVSPFIDFAIGDMVISHR